MNRFLLAATRRAAPCLLSSFCCLFAASAGIVTEQNNVASYTADYATIGSNTAGIASCWIPYGTYTGGTGSTEYTRVTSNLVGVVASVYDGYLERSRLPLGQIPSAEAGDTFYMFCPPSQITNEFTDAGEFLRTNGTLRILESVNPGRRLAINQSGTNYTYWTERHNGIERMLAEGDGNAQSISGDCCYANGGLAAGFGSRALDSIVQNQLGTIEPPISTSWSGDTPFGTNSVEAWNRTWPTFAALTNDVHFFPAETNLFHQCPRPWASWIVGSNNEWGRDVDDAAYDMATNIERRSLPVSMEDVLAVDTGWQADDYAHWRNGSTRLDWKRLGIICQLERQMEQSYYGRYVDEDLLPFLSVSTKGRLVQVADAPSGYLGTPSSSDAEVYIPLNEVASWTQTTNYVIATTNATTGWSCPTARCGKSSVRGFVAAGNRPSGYNFSSTVPLLLAHSDLVSMIESCSGLPSDCTNVYFWAYFDFSVSATPGVGVGFVNCFLYDDPDNIFTGYIGDSCSVHIGIPPMTNSTALYCTVEKSIPAIWTSTHPDWEAQTLARIEGDSYPSSNVWARSWVASQIRPSIETLISLDGDKALDYMHLYFYSLPDEYRPEPLQWDDLQYNHAAYLGRWFRMNPAAAATTSKRASDHNRYAMLCNLNSEVHGKFAALAGFGIDDLPQRAQVSQSDKAGAMASIDGKSIHASFRCVPWDFFDSVDDVLDHFEQTGDTPVSIDDLDHYFGWGSVTNYPNQLWLSVRFSTCAGHVTQATVDPAYLLDLRSGDPRHRHELVNSDGSITVGYSFWSIDDVQGDSYTNGTDRVAAVEGHHKEMVKTLWRFKNLRDPTL